MTTMRAKVKVGSVFPLMWGENGEKVGEALTFHGVSKSGAYPDDGLDEDNTFAKFSPSVELRFDVRNPALFDKFKPGDTFYVDFTPVEQKS